MPPFEQGVMEQGSTSEKHAIENVSNNTSLEDYTVQMCKKCYSIFLYEDFSSSNLPTCLPKVSIPAAKMPKIKKT